MARFRKGMRCYVKSGRYGGQYGTIGGSEYDEETGLYQRYVLIDPLDEEDSPEERLINVKHLRPLTEAEWWMEAVENDDKEWDETRIRNFGNMPIDVTKKPRYYGVPIRPFPVKGAEQLSLFDDSLAERV